MCISESSIGGYYVGFHNTRDIDILTTKRQKLFEFFFFSELVEKSFSLMTLAIVLKNRILSQMSQK
jgi:hypothetical protein